MRIDRERKEERKNTWLVFFFLTDWVISIHLVFLLFSPWTIWNSMATRLVSMGKDRSFPYWFHPVIRPSSTFGRGGWKNNISGNATTSRFFHFLPCVHHIFAAGTCRPLSLHSSWEGVTLDNCMLDYYYTRFRWGFLSLSVHPSSAGTQLFRRPPPICLPPSSPDEPRDLHWTCWVGQPNCVCLLDKSTHHQFID